MIKLKKDEITYTLIDHFNVRINGEEKFITKAYVEDFGEDFLTHQGKSYNLYGNEYFCVVEVFNCDKSKLDRLSCGIFKVVLPDRIYIVIPISFYALITYNLYKTVLKMVK